MDTGEDILLSFIYAWGKSKKNNESIPTKTHLQKEIFLLMRRSPFLEMKDMYKFIPLWYGPFSIELSKDISKLQEQNLITGDTYNIGLTPSGFKKASTIYNKLNSLEKEQIFEVKSKYNFMKLEDLLRKVYDMYPKFTTKSVLKKENVDLYFKQYLKNENISEDDIIEAVNIAKEQTGQ